MANSREDLFNPRNLDSYDNPISEVGSGPLMTVVEHLAAIADRLTRLQESRPSAEPERLVLPRFNPEVAGADPAAWCATVDVIMEKDIYQTTNYILPSVVLWRVPQHSGLRQSLSVVSPGRNSRNIFSTIMPVRRRQPQRY
jgi:hypothetical protein